MTNTSLLRRSVIYGQKRFMTLGPVPNVAKLVKNSKYACVGITLV